MTTTHTAGKLHGDGLWLENDAGGDVATVVEAADAMHLALCWNTHDDLVAALQEVIYAYDVVDARDDDSGYELQMRMADIMEQVREAHAVAKGEG